MTQDMILSPEKSVRINHINSNLASIQNTDSSKIFLQQRWGTINFHDLIDEFEHRFKPTISLLLQSDLSFLSVSELDLLLQTTAGIETSMHEVSSFSIEIQNAPTVRNEIRDKFQTAMRKLETVTSKYSTPILLQAFSSTSTMMAAEYLLTAAKKQLEETENQHKETAKANTEIQNILISAREAAGKIGVVEHAKTFQEEASTLQITSFVWLGAMAFMVTFTAILATYFYRHPVFLMGDMSMAVQIVAAKIVLLVLFLTTTVWCGRNYRALAHEASVNKHRANALATFQTFVGATNDDGIKNTVLLEATRSIFVHAPSGYLDKNDNNGSDSKMADIARSVTSLTRVH